MSARHHVGRLFHSAEEVSGFGTQCAHLHPEGEAGALARLYDFKLRGQAIENARRLAAAWNACEGLSTDSLESGGPLSARFEREQDRADAAEIRAERLQTAVVGLLAEVRGLLEDLRAQHAYSDTGIPYAQHPGLISNMRAAEKALEATP